MANLIAGKRVVPELIQSKFTASNIVMQLQPLLPDGPRRQSMRKELAAIRTLLLARMTDDKRTGGGAIGRVADIRPRTYGGGVSRAGMEEAYIPEVGGLPGSSVDNRRRMGKTRANDEIRIQTAPDFGPRTASLRRRS